MAFRDFTYPEVIGKLGLTEETVPDLYTAVTPVAPGEPVLSSLPLGTQLGPAAHSEVARMIWMVGPILLDIWKRYRGHISLNAGVEFDADPATQLTGYCDFIISRGPQRAVVGAPAVLIFEAKRDSIPDGLGQCIAAMEGTVRYNRRHNSIVNPIFGCVTTGSLWKFMELSGGHLRIDLTEYTISQVERIISILIHMVGPIPQPVAA
jgi:hypothetical protein